MNEAEGSYYLFSGKLNVNSYTLNFLKITFYFLQTDIFGTHKIFRYRKYIFLEETKIIVECTYKNIYTILVNNVHHFC